MCGQRLLKPELGLLQPMRDLEIFAQAIEIADPDHRRQFVNEACAGDDALSREVLRLLEAHSRAGSLLDSPAPSSELLEKIRAQAEQPIPPVATRDEAPPFASVTHRTIGPYRLLEKIGEGGFGEVFVAEQTEPVQRKVAIKIIKPGMDSREVVARFAAEQQALALMDHPNIARVFDAGTTPRGLPYFVMELVRGMNIVKYCDTAKLPIEKRLSLFIDTCKAIQHAHQKGIIHRDIKPSNILVTLHDGEPVVKVIDFGVAKALNQRLTHMTVYTRFSFMIGTPAYMSPEQAELSGLDIDTRSDIYSLGVLLYELITGSPPFRPDRFARATMDEMRRIIRDEEPPKPSMRVSTVGPAASSVAQLRSVEPMRLQSILRRDLDWIAMKALAKDRSQRYETANGLAADVRRFLDGDAVTARPPSWSYVTSRFIRRNRGLVISAALILTALLLGTVISISLAVWALREQGIAHIQEQVAVSKSYEADAQRERAQRAEKEALSNLLASRMAFTDLNLASRRPGQQVESMNAIRESIDLARKTRTLDQHTLRLRTQVISALARVDLNHVRSCEAPPEATTFFSFTADFSKVAYRVRENGQNFITIRAVDTPEKELQRVPFPFNTRNAFHDEVASRLSGDGRYLAMGNGQVGMVVWDLARNKIVRELKAYYTIGGFQFSGDSTMFAVVERGPGNTADRVNLCRLPTGEIERSIELSQPRQVAFSPDGRQIAVGGQNALWVCEVATGKRLASIEKSFDGWGPAMAWSASGEYLAASLDWQIEVWDVDQLIEAETRRSIDHSNRPAEPVLPVSLLTGHEGKVESLMFHPIHEFMLVSTGWENATRIWNIFSGKEQLMLPESRPSISADGQRLATAVASGFRLYDLLAGDACRWTCRGVVTQVEHDPHGNWLVMGTGSGTRFWSLPDLKPLGEIGSGASYCVAWDRSKEGLLIGNSLGLFEVPITAGSGILKTGPSHQLLTTSLSSFGHVGTSTDGRWVASVEIEDWEPIVLDRVEGNARRLHRDARSQCHALSGNSLWLAQFVGGRVCVRDLNTNKDVADLDFPGTNCGVCFSPDSRYLLLSSNRETQFVDTATWEVAHRFSPAIRIFSAGFFHGQNACVIPSAPGELSVISMDDQQVLARLTYPDPPRLFAFASMTRDDRFLAITHESSAAVWDMGMVRSRLRELGLDWNANITPAPDARVPIESLQVVPGELETLQQFVDRMDASPRVDVAGIADEMIQKGRELPDLYRFRGWSYEALGDSDAACQDLKRAIEMAPYAESWRLACAECLMQAFRFREAWEVYWTMADPNHSRKAVQSFQQICYICATRPEVVPDRESFQQLLESWSEALTGKDTTSSYGQTVAGIGDDAKRTLWEAVGMALYGLGQPDRSLAILKEHARESRHGGNSVLAAIYAGKGELEAAEKHLQAALDYPRNQTGTAYTRLHLNFYDPLQKYVMSRLDAGRREKAGADDDPAVSGKFDSVDLAKSASASFGQILLYPSNDKPEINEALSNNLLWWELVRPEHEIRFDLAVPGPGKYRLSARFAGSYYCGKFRVIRDREGGEEEGPSIDLYHAREKADDPALKLIEDFALGEFEAVKLPADTTAGNPAMPESGNVSNGEPPPPWVLPLVLRSTGRQEKSVQYSLLIDEISWERVEEN